MSDPHNFADRHLLQNIIFVFLSEKEEILNHFNFPPQITKMIHAHMIASKPGYQITASPIQISKPELMQRTAVTVKAPVAKLLVVIWGHRDVKIIRDDKV